MPIHKTNMGSVRDRREAILRQESERAANAHFDELKPGNNIRRILPPWSAEGLWRKHAFFHYGIKEKGNIVCPNKTFQQPCPVCEEVEQLYKLGKTDPEAKQLAQDMRAKERFFANVLDYDKNDGKVYILAFGPKLEADLTTMMYGGASPDGQSVFGVGDVTDVQTGRLLQITKTVNPKDKKLTEYGVTPSSTGAALPNAEAFCNALHNLDEFVMKDAFTYDQIKALMNRTSGGSAPGAQTSSAPAPAPGTVHGFTAPGTQMNQASPPAPGRMTSEFEPPKGAIPTPPPPPTPPAPPAPGAVPGANFGALASAAPTGPAKPSSALDRLRAMQGGAK